jgi:hypothetical protein
MRLKVLTAVNGNWNVTPYSESLDHNWRETSNRSITEPHIQTQNTSAAEGKIVSKKRS